MNLCHLCPFLRPGRKASGFCHQPLRYYDVCRPKTLVLLDDAQVHDDAAEKPRWASIQGLQAPSFQAHADVVLDLCRQAAARGRRQVLCFEEPSMSQSTNAWDGIFAQQGRVFAGPHEDMPGIIHLLKDRGASTVLDLGSGSGRHVVYLARHGFAVFGLDNSPQGIKATRQWLADEGLTAELRLQSMANGFPYEDGFFDAVVCVQVIHHADMATIRGIVKEVSRVLKRGGFLFVTVPQLRNQGETFEQLEPNTYIPLDGPERGLPHHYFTPDELREVFGGYDIIDVHLDAWDHYCLSAFKG